MRVFERGKLSCHPRMTELIIFTTRPNLVAQIRYHLRSQTTPFCINLCHYRLSIWKRRVEVFSGGSCVAYICFLFLFFYWGTVLKSYISNDFRMLIWVLVFQSVEHPDSKRKVRGLTLKGDTFWNMLTRKCTDASYLDLNENGTLVACLI